MFSSPESMNRRLRNCIRGKMPKVDAVRDLLSQIDPDELRNIHEETIDRMKRNRIWKHGTIGGCRVAAVDGVELFGSTKNLARTVWPADTANRGRNTSTAVLCA